MGETVTNYFGGSKIIADGDCSHEIKTHLLLGGREQDGGGVGERLYLSPKISQEYTFRHRSACITPAESGQEYLTSGKEYIEPCRTW